MGEMKNVAADKKREFGQLLNEFKIFAEAKYEKLKAATATSTGTATNEIDLILARRSFAAGFQASYQPCAQQDRFHFSALRLCCG